MAANSVSNNPYLGLRPFEESDASYFFGREDHVGDLLALLEHNRFLAVVGQSGSGKSSLVKAGLIPALKGAGLPKASSGWLIVTMTPETEPIERLVKKLKEAVAKKYPDEKRSDWNEGVGKAMRFSRSGLVDAVSKAHLPDRINTLVVVDQFEELFRYKQQDEAEGFVQRLIAATKSSIASIYVVITMRSDYIGECAKYGGLAEAVNSGLYLTPRLVREQLEEAIGGPARMAGGEISDDLIELIVNSVQLSPRAEPDEDALLRADQDQLPVLQHALMRCWHGEQTVNRERFEEVGGADALDQHANDVLREVEKKNADYATITELLFKTITEPGSNGGSRRPAKFKDIQDVIGCTEDDLRYVIEAFRREDRAFLTPRPIKPGDETVVTGITPEALTLDSMIDISHESLIRRWKKLVDWIKEEATSAELYTDLVKAAQRPNDRLPASRIPYVLEVKKARAWNARWADRYGGGFDEAIAFLENSRAYYRRTKKWQIIGAVCCGIAVAALAGLYFYNLDQRNKKTLEMAKSARQATWPSLPISERIKGALNAKSLENDLTIPGFVEQEVSLYDWELLGNLQQKDPGFSAPTEDNDRFDSNRIAVHRYVDRNNFELLVAVALGKSVSIWSLKQERDKKAANPTDITPPELKGSSAKWVRFSHDGSKLVVLELDGSLALNSFKVAGSSVTFDQKIQLSAADKANSTADSYKKIVAMGLTPDFKSLILLSSVSLFIYPLTGGTGISVFESQPSIKIKAGRFSSDDRYLLILNELGRVQLMDLRKPKSRGNPASISLNGDGVGSAFFGEGDSLILGTARGYMLMRPNPFEASQKTSGTSSPVAVGGITAAITCQCKEGWIAVGTSNGYVEVFNEKGINAGSPEWAKPAHRGAVQSIAFADSERIITAGSDGDTRVFETRTGVETHRIHHGEAVVWAEVAEVTGVSKPDRVISATQNGRLRVATLVSSSREWRKQDCLATPLIAVSPSLRCQGEEQDAEFVLRSGSNPLLSPVMKLSDDGEHLVWVTAGPTPTISVNRVKKQAPIPLPEDWPDGNSVLPAISSDGNWFAAVNRLNPTRVYFWPSIEPKYFEIPEPSKGAQTKTTRATGANTVMNSPNRQVTALAIAKDGSVAIGMFGRAVAFKKQASPEWSFSTPESDADNGSLTTALSFVEKKGKPSQIFAARDDQKITIFQIENTVLKTVLNPLQLSFSVNLFVVNNSANKVAACGGSQCALFMRRTDGTYDSSFTLREPGAVQAARFDEVKDTFITSVAPHPENQDAIVRTTHSLKMADLLLHACASLPPQDYSKYSACKP